MAVVYEKSIGLTDRRLHYCPGCTHGIIHKLLAECMVEMGVLDTSIGCASVGCTGLCCDYFNCDMVQCAHGRAPAVATALKRIHPDSFVWTYQGDGDLASIGTAEIVHAAHRSEKITTLFVNNAIYGMTGGQMAPTTLIGQKTTTSPMGRDPKTAGEPIRVCEMMAAIPGTKFAERVALDTPAHIRQAKKVIKKAMQCQISGVGFALVEILSTCPTNWGLSPVNAQKWLRENMIPYYPLGNFKDCLDK